MKRRIRHRDGSKISAKEASGLAKLAVLMHESTARNPSTGPEIVIVEQPPVVYLPADMTCLRCNSAQALPGRLWCTPCVEYVDALPAEPVDDELEASIARHPAGKQLRAGEPK
jgi:hypothetical protein